MNANKQASIDFLRDLCPVGSTVYTQLEHVSKSGMTRWIKPIVIVNNQPHYIAYHVEQALGWKRTGKHDGNKVDGCGMDMGFHLVYTLSQVLHGDGYALAQRWL